MFRGALAYVSGAIGAILAKLIVGAAASGHFNVVVLEPLNSTDARPNAHLHLGYNLSAGPTLKPEKAGEPSLTVGLESYYEEGPIRYVEHYVQYFNAAGVGPIRPWFTRINRATDAIESVLRGDPIRVVNQAAQEIARFTGSGTVNVGSTAPGAVGAFTTEGVSSSPRSCRFAFGTDDSGWELRFSKRNGGTTTDLWGLTDSGHFLPVTSAAFDVGAPTRSVRTVYAQAVNIKDGSGMAAIFIDPADGLLKIRRADDTVKTIHAD